MNNGRENRQPWQPKRKRRRPARRNTNWPIATRTTGTPQASPKFLRRNSVRFACLWQFRNAFLGFRAKQAIGAGPALNARFGRKLSGSDLRGNVCNRQLRFFQLHFAALGADRRVPFEVVKDEVRGPVSPFCSCRQSIERELQAVVGVLLRLGPSGLVVSDDHGSVGPLIHAVDAAYQVRWANLHAEAFFRMQNFCGRSVRSRQKFLQLSNTLLLVEIVLVRITNSFPGEVSSKQLYERGF